MLKIQSLGQEVPFVTAIYAVALLYPLLRSGGCTHKRQIAEPPQLCPQRSGARSRICKLVLLVLPLCLSLSRLSRLMASWISPFREVE